MRAYVRAAGGGRCRCIGVGVDRGTATRAAATTTAADEAGGLQFLIGPTDRAGGQVEVAKGWRIEGEAVLRAQFALSRSVIANCRRSCS